MKRKNYTSEEVEAITREIRQDLERGPLFFGIVPSKDGRSGPRRMNLSNDLYDGRLKHEELITMARSGDVDAADVLRDTARADLVRRMSESGTIPAWILQYYDGLTAGKIALNGRRQRGRNQHGNLDRDWEIILAVDQVAKRGFSRTPNLGNKDESANPSACSIVAAALGPIGINLSERGVAAIWGRREKVRKSLNSYGHCRITKI
jgi:hypothetical protein